jgi:hypothetical protein
MAVAAASPPEQGQLVSVRSRQWIVTDVRPSTLPTPALRPIYHGPQPLLTLASTEDDGLGEELQVIWEIEPGARVIEKVALPEPSGFDPPDKLDVFPVATFEAPLNAYTCKPPTPVKHLFVMPNGVGRYPVDASGHGQPRFFASPSFRDSPRRLPLRSGHLSHRLGEYGVIEPDQPAERPGAASAGSSSAPARPVALFSDLPIRPLGKYHEPW